MNTDSESTRILTQRPRTTDHGAGMVGSGIFLSKRRQNSVQNKADSRHIRDLTDFLLLLKKNMKKKCLSVILDYYHWYTTKVADKNSDRKCFDDRILCQLFKIPHRTTLGCLRARASKVFNVVIICQISYRGN